MKVMNHFKSNKVKLRITTANRVALPDTNSSFQPLTQPDPVKLGRLYGLISGGMLLFTPTFPFRYF